MNKAPGQETAAPKPSLSAYMLRSQISEGIGWTLRTGVYGGMDYVLELCVCSLK